MNRRKALLNICAGSCAISSGVILESCTSTPHISATIDKNNIVQIAKSAFLESTYLVIQNSKLPASFGLLKLSDNSYLANLLLCTHKNCELQTAGKYLVCPCHGSEFTQKGKVITGPAMKNLLKLPVATFDNYININVTKLQS